MLRERLTESTPNPSLDRKGTSYLGEMPGMGADEVTYFKPKLAGKEPQARSRRL